MRQRIDLKEPFVIFECVPQQGIDEYERCIGEYYRLERVTLSCHKQGWSIRRPRQYVIGELRRLHVPAQPSRATFQEFIHACFGRGCSYNPLEYCISTSAER
eukprot:7779544-Pyramimonas_sp.AAC.1